MSASEASKEDKQLEASQRRLDQAREEGQLPRSRELGHLAVALSAIGLLLAAGPWLGKGALELVGRGLRFDRAAAFEEARMATRLADLGGEGLLLAAPVSLVLALLLAACGVAVGGWNLTSKALEPKLDRLDPLAGFGRMFSLQGMLQHLRVVAAAAALVAAAGLYLWNHGGELQNFARMPLVAALSAGVDWIAAGMTLLALVAFAVALIDVPLQIFRHKSELRMTHDEAKQENKESEGDPHVKGQRRRMARELSRGRMLADVPKASVVVTNPTHYAVALAYEEGAGGAPRIVAMGTDHLALKIREVAKASRVPTLEAPPLARALYRHGDIGAEVPVALYTAVAQVLAWVYALRDARRTPETPVIEVPASMDPQAAEA
ncbi:EscU/YscU/HrcU family type III secretion system export apparatus switch protein [Ramlibacter humi]|uniref:EscU/YscU/HrcU family type III secretion system export apparatus switch protein n=1 Tax=Ramlibacter humi TaxID=2530451 RepID=A0A4Z0CAJ4_9BURK|nr:flagellar type III secretion system protein FlhB [Ramlibacter humi]TFZ08361.1 EscU/YscU/HrcU family type III secretion system export apparatus switch protein [Ramlibacter humi]